MKKMTKKERDIISVACCEFQGKADFFRDIFRFIEEPEMLEALQKDSIEIYDPLFDPSEKLYQQLNSAQSFTRQYLILKTVENNAKS